MCVPERREEVLGLLRRELDDVALVMPMEDGAGEGLFGPQPVCPELRRRLGDILILPYLGNFVWWREPGLMQNDFYGHHGGLSPRGADHGGGRDRRAVIRHARASGHPRKYPRAPR